jgi:hypothetical protein
VALVAPALGAAGAGLVLRFPRVGVALEACAIMLAIVAILAWVAPLTEDPWRPRRHRRR